MLIKPHYWALLTDPSDYPSLLHDKRQSPYGTESKCTCLAPITNGIKHSGSVACVDSSIRTCTDEQPGFIFRRTMVLFQKRFCHDNTSDNIDTVSFEQSMCLGYNFQAFWVQVPGRTSGICRSYTLDLNLIALLVKGLHTWRKRKLARRGSPAPTHVQQITSALCEISLSVALFNALYFFSSALDSSPRW
jgi:hypothetical protein